MLVAVLKNVSQEIDQYFREKPLGTSIRNRIIRGEKKFKELLNMDKRWILWESFTNIHLIIRLEREHMKTRSFLGILSLFLLLFPAMAGAAMITAHTVTDTVMGSDMVGLKVTAQYYGGSTSSVAEFVVFDPLGSGNSSAGIASNSDFSLMVTNDTYGNPWYLKNYSTNAMLSLTLEGNHSTLFPGFVFDLIDGVDITPGSSFGKHELSTSYTGLVTFIESEQVKYQNHPLSDYNDLWSRVTFEFGDGTDSNTGLQGGDGYSFSLDTDSVTVVPIPGTVLLLGSGLLCLIGIRRNPFAWRA